MEGKVESGTQPISFGVVLKNFFWDILIMFVLVLNLLLICWDWFFSIPDVYGYFMENCHAFFAFYNPIHIDIRFYDLLFVSVYVLDLVAGWCLSVFRRKERFLEYPFSHWYDVLGCIPVGSMVYLRLLRLVSIFMRLYKKRLINPHKYAFFRKCIKIYNIILEEISDRVVLNILGGIKSNIKLGMPITKEIINKIVIPHKRQIIDLVFSKVQSIASQEYSGHKADLAGYIRAKSCSAVEGNKELSRLKMIPVVGPQIQECIERSVSDTVVQVVDSLVMDVLSDKGQNFMKEITNEVSDFALENLESELSKIVTDIVVEVVNLIARTANIKQWKLTELREQLNIARTGSNPDKDLISRLENDYEALFRTEMDKNWE